MMNNDFDEYLLDSELGIRTTGRNDRHSDTHRYPYEPTAYAVLARMLESEYLQAEDVVLDYGCGMGRVPIYLNKKLGCQGIGIELVKEFYLTACENAIRSDCDAEVEFICGKAEEYELSDDVTACFFFNPFDIGIFRGVMKRITDSYEEHPRRIRLFFYYPQDEYIAFLMTRPQLEFVDEIDCVDLFAGNDSRNRVMVFEIN